MQPISLITGAYAGIGVELARVLAQHDPALTPTAGRMRRRG